MYKVVNGKQIIGRVENSDEYFFGHCGKGTEDEYRQMLEDSQEFLYKYATGEITDENRGKYYIYAPENYLEENLATEIYKISDGSVLSANEALFSSPVRVIKKGPFYLFSGEDGRHRYYVAKKYRYNLLVEVVDV